MRIRDVLRHKGDQVVTIPADRTIHDAMRALVVHGIGSLVVWGDPIAGIITERDLLTFATQRPDEIDTVKVEDVMTREVIVGAPDDKLHCVMDVMTKNRIRHLPVMEEQQLVGLVSIGDVVNAIRREAEDECQSLHEYIGGTVA